MIREHARKALSFPPNLTEIQKNQRVLAWAETTKGPTVFISDDDMNQTINTIIGSLADGASGYYLASAVYNSDFFEGETPEFCRALCTALNTKFVPFKNNYWIKLTNQNNVGLTE